MSALAPVTDHDWRFLADGVMGGLSEGRARIETAGGRRALRLTGTVRVENRGGFIQARTAFGPAPAGARGIALEAAGNGERYFVHLRVAGAGAPWAFWQAGFDTGAEWRRVELPWTAFEGRGGLTGRIEPAAIVSLGLAAYGRAHAADLAVAALGWLD